MRNKFFCLILSVTIFLSCGKPFEPGPVNTGDINLNGIQYEIADAILFSNYLVYGDPVFDIDFDEQIRNSDINRDKTPATVADLVSLFRIVNGYSYEKPPVQKQTITTYSHSRLSVNIELGGAFIVIEGNVPFQVPDNMEYKANFDGTNTKILIYSTQSNIFTGVVIETIGKVLSYQLSTGEGGMVKIAHEVNSVFELTQNYPNPFRDSTAISFSIPTRQNIKLEFYDINSKVVDTYSANLEAGFYTYHFDGTYHEAGIYYYRMTVEDPPHSVTKSMLLVK